MPRHTTRRAVVRAGTLGAALAVAGCLASQSEPSDDEGGDDDHNSTTNRSTDGVGGDDDPPADDGDDTQGDDGTDDDDDDDGETDDPTLLDDFEELHVWSARDGSLAADTNRSLIGSQSASVRVGSDESRALLERSFDPPLDLSDAGLQLGLRAEERVRPWIQAFDADGDRIDFRAIVPADLPLHRYGFGIENIVGSPDFDAIERLQIVAFEGDEGNRVWCDELRRIDRPGPGRVMLHFDRSHETCETVVNPILKEFDLPATAFLNPALLGTETHGESRLSEEQVADLADAGWEIANGSMRYAHLSRLDEESQSRRIDDAAAWLTDRGYEADWFAYPHADYDESTREIVDADHELAFGRGWIAPGQVWDHLAVPRVLSSPASATIQDQIDLIARVGGVTAFVYDRVTARDAPSFRANMEYLRERAEDGDIEVVAIGDVADDLVANDRP